MTPAQHAQVTAVSFIGTLLVGMVPQMVALGQGLTLPLWFAIAEWIFAYYMGGVAARSLARQFREEEQQ